MIILKADNKELFSGAKYSYLNTNYASGSSTFVLSSVVGISVNDYLFFGNLDSESAEVLKVVTVTPATNTITTVASVFSHSESTRVTVISHNQVKFYWTSTDTFATTTPLNGGVAINIQTDSLYTLLQDGSHTSGYGWFVFYSSLLIGGTTTQFDIVNPVEKTFRYQFNGIGIDPDIINKVFVGSEVVINGETFNVANNGTFTVTAVGKALVGSVLRDYFEITNDAGVVENNKALGTGSLTVNNTSANSNAMPYAGFTENSANNILRDFYSILNNKERNLVSDEDAFSWLNEAYSLVINELNLVNSEYTTQSTSSISVVAGTAEYDLPTDFSNVISLYDGTGLVEIESIYINDISSYGATSANTVKYYLRGNYIGFTPTPTGGKTYTLRYNISSPKIDSIDDLINIPDKVFYALKDYMMFRASPKLNRADGAIFYQNFVNAINRLKVDAIKRDNASDSWQLDPTCNV